MSTALHPLTSIRARLAEAPDRAERFLWGATGSVCLGDLVSGTRLGSRATELSGRSVLIATRDPYAAALALIGLDGTARRLILCTPDLSAADLSAVIETAGVDAIVSDVQNAQTEFPIPDSQFQVPTEWVLLTSGTSGAPKMIVHNLASLTAPITGAGGAGTVWGTFYDIRRYGGLQIFLRTIFGHGSLVVSGAGESIGEYLVRLGAHGATHVSGTPSHWRRALMSPAARAITPRYVRLSGEIADQGILNALQAFYPGARVSHAFASTEAGVGFDVDDGLEGFPARIVGAPGDVEIRVDDGSLRIRSARNGLRYLSEERVALADEDGFVDTGDMVTRRGDRFYFLGRRSGIINVGGLKVHPEEVEAAINRHPAVRMSMVRSTRSVMTGSLVVADVVLQAPFDQGDAGQTRQVRREILKLCHDRLAPHKIPAMIRFVATLEIADAGKLVRDA